mgnify:FL=1
MIKTINTFTRAAVFAPLLLLAVCASPPSEAHDRGIANAHTCSVIGEAFRATIPSKIWQERLLEAQGSNAQTGAVDPTRERDSHIALPQVQYPKLLDRPSAVCELIFDLDTRGKPSKIDAVCSDPRFESAAIAGLEKARFKSARSNGGRVPYYGVLYPIEFCVSG